MRGTLRFRTPWGIRLGLAVLAVAATAVAAMQTIERDGVVLRAGPGSFHPVVAPLPEGRRVEVLGERGPWLRVADGGTEGWVSRSAFEEPKSGGLRAFSSSTGSQQASASGETAAVKGFDTEIERAHGEGRGQDWSELAALDQQQVATEDMLAFLRARGFLPDQPAAPSQEVTK